MFFSAVINQGFMNTYQILKYVLIFFSAALIIAYLCASLFTKIISPKKKAKQLPNEKFEIAGFAYNEEQDIFYSVRDAWQREYGYCHFYDEMATPFSMVVDSEPIIFKYNNKLWLIEFWKGQYGMTTGAEIGIYSAPITKKNIKEKAVFFNCVSDEEMLKMSYILLKNNEFYFLRSAKHWWLTGFKLGAFAKPEELKMHISINFPDVYMRDIFVKALLARGYPSNKIKTLDNKVYVLFDKPHTKQPCTRNRLLDGIAQFRNKFFVDTYNELIGDTGNTLDKLKILKEKKPRLYKRLNKIGFSPKHYASVAFLKRGKRKPGE